MPIERDAEWGTIGLLATEPESCFTDAELATRSAGSVSVLCGGNLWKSLGSAGLVSSSDRVRLLPIDALVIDVEDADGDMARTLSADSLVICRPWWRGGCLRGPLLIVSNSGLWRGRTVLPRAHPNDGVFDLLDASALGVRDRLLAWSRSRTDDHLRHRLLVTKRLAAWESGNLRGLRIRIDGQRVKAATLTAHVAPDHWTVALPLPLP